LTRVIGVARAKPRNGGGHAERPEKWARVAILIEDRRGCDKSRPRKWALARLRRSFESWSSVMQISEITGFSAAGS
jgi:hypothetical protein